MVFAPAGRHLSMKLKVHFFCCWIMLTKQLPKTSNVFMKHSNAEGYYEIIMSCFHHDNFYSVMNVFKTFLMQHEYPVFEAKFKTSALDWKAVTFGFPFIRFKDVKESRRTDTALQRLTSEKGVNYKKMKWDSWIRLTCDSHIINQVLVRDNIIMNTACVMDVK